VTVVPPLLVLTTAGASASLLLRERPAFAYAPFLTLASLAAAAVVAGWTAFAWRAWRACEMDEASDCTPVLTIGERGLLVAIAAGAALLWGREELSRVGSPDVS